MRTCCCHTKHYKTENQSVICMNRNCSNYLATTRLLSKAALKLFNASLLFAFILCFCKNDYSSVSRTYGSHSCLSEANITKIKRLIPCTDATLKAEIQEKKIICPDEVYAQIVIES